MQTGAGMYSFKLKCIEKSWSCCELFFVCRFIKYCTEEGGYTGYNISNLEETDDVVDRLLALNMRALVLGKNRPYMPHYMSEESVVKYYIFKYCKIHTAH